MEQAREFIKIIKNGERKKMQRAKLPPFLKKKHTSTQSVLNMIARLRWVD